MPEWEKKMKELTIEKKILEDDQYKLTKKLKKEKKPKNDEQINEVHEMVDNLSKQFD